MSSKCNAVNVILSGSGTNLGLTFFRYAVPAVCCGNCFSLICVLKIHVEFLMKYKINSFIFFETACLHAAAQKCTLVDSHLWIFLT